MRRTKAKQSPNLLTIEMITREALRILEENKTFTKLVRDANGDETALRRLEEESRAGAEYWRLVGAGEIEFPLCRPRHGEYQELLELHNIARLK